MAWNAVEYFRFDHNFWMSKYLTYRKIVITKDEFHSCKMRSLFTLFFCFFLPWVSSEFNDKITNLPEFMKTCSTLKLNHWLCQCAKQKVFDLLVCGVIRNWGNWTTETLNHANNNFIVFEHRWAVYLFFSFFFFAQINTPWEVEMERNIEKIV